MFIDLFSTKNIKEVNIGPFFWREKVVILDFHYVFDLEKANKTIKNNKGFTLPELLVSAIIMTVAFLMILMIYASCCALEEAGRNLIVATSHADFIMEDIRNTNFSSIATNINNGYWNWNSSNITAASLTPLNNEVITTQASGTNPLDVTVTVTWRDTQQRNRTKVLETLISG